MFGSAEDGQSGSADGPQWSLGGDTWVVGCRIPDSIIYPEFNALNPDMQDTRYNTTLGVYQQGCGLMDNAKFAWGHDEYLYQVLKFNDCSLPEEGLAMIRLHSCYAWHLRDEYEHMMNEKDRDLKYWVTLFNRYDLYTKADVEPNVAELWPYYQMLIDKYCPGKLRW
jgi:inositol oxygenase